MGSIIALKFDFEAAIGAHYEIIYVSNFHWCKV